jgi:hypothetical protein
MGGMSGTETADDYSLEKSERMAREYGTRLLAKRPFLKQPPAQNPQSLQAFPEQNMPIWRFPLKGTMNHNCPICRYRNHNTDIVFKPCGHGTCFSCFRRSMRANTVYPICPICRARIEDFLPFVVPPVDPAID